MGLGFILFEISTIFVTTGVALGILAHLSLATSHGNVDESASIRDSLLRTALGRLLLLLRLNL